MTLKREPGRSSTVAYKKRKPSIREQVYQLLRNDMRQGKIGYDERLVDHEIAAGLNVSRMPVREALMQLKSEGYLDGTPRGFVLTQFTPAEISNIFAVRRLLEPAAGADACEHATPEGLEQMQKAVEEVESTHASGDIIGNLRANWAFREAWLSMVPNLQLVETMNRLRDRADLARWQALHDPVFRGATLQRVKGILAAFVQQDAKEVRARVDDNLRLCALEYQAKQREILSEPPMQ